VPKKNYRDNVFQNYEIIVRNCFDCPCYYILDGQKKCNAHFGREIEEPKEVPKWCKLRKYVICIAWEDFREQKIDFALRHPKRWDKKPLGALGEIREQILKNKSIFLDGDKK
jgi:hypothetical protein